VTGPGFARRNPVTVNPAGSGGSLPPDVRFQAIFSGGAAED
jgi:hypothetical protein